MIGRAAPCGREPERGVDRGRAVLEIAAPGNFCAEATPRPSSPDALMVTRMG